MITLFIDTSTESLTIALFKDDVLLSTSTESSSEHSKYAMPILEQIFKENNIKPNMVNKIMVINGPGSFTGIRIGVTIAKIYAWALNINIVPISSLKAYAISNKNYDYYVSIIDARRNYVYAGIYDKNYDNVIKESYISKDELADKVNSLSNILVIGDTSLDDFPVRSNKIDVVSIYNYFKNDSGINAYMVNPVYLKKTEAEEKLGDY